MKKTIIYGIICIFLGYILGNILFINKDIFNYSKGEKYYLLQEGIYTDENILNSYQNNLKQRIIEKENNKISVYIGITRNLEVAEKLLNIYEEKNTKLSIVERYYTNEELKNNIEQFDFLILSSKDKDEILKIEEVVLASFDEIMNYIEN